MEVAWKHIWDKPLRTHVKTEEAQQWVNRMESYMLKAWEFWGTDPNRFCITRHGKDHGNECFALEGDLAADIQALHIAYSRLYAIQGAAKAMNDRVKKYGGHPVKDFAEIPSNREPMTQWVRGMEEEFGWGWGPATVHHMLMDFGMSVKPDLHLIRAMRHLDLWHDDKDSLLTEESAEIVCRVRKLTEVVCPPIQSLQHLDRGLMHISKYVLIGEDPEKHPPRPC